MTLLVRHTDVLGGVVGGFNPLMPFLGWRTYSVVASYVDPEGVELPAIRIRKTSGPPTDTISQHGSRVNAFLVPREWPYGNGQLKGHFPELAWYFLDPATWAFVAGPLLPIGNTFSNLLDVATRDTTPVTDHVVQWFEHTLPTGPYIGIHAALAPSDIYPIFVSGHPVEIVAEKLTQKGEAYDAASAAAVTASLGPELQHIVPITAKDETPQDIIDSLSEAYGFSVRRATADGSSEFVHWREKIATLPVPILDMNSIREEGGPTFELSDASRLTRVRVSGQVLTRWQDGVVTAPRVLSNAHARRFFRRSGKSIASFASGSTLSTDKPASGIAITPAEITYDYSTDGATPDSEVYGATDIDLDVVGMPGVLNTVAGGASPFNFEQWAEGLARLIFDATARGRQMATVVGLRGTDFDDVEIGDACTLDLDHLPNAQLGQAPTSQRGGQRPFRCLSRTEEVPGPVLLLADEGTGVQYATVPTISVRPDAEQANNGLLIVDVGNAATLTTDKAQVEFQVRLFADGATVDLSFPGLRYTIDDATDWPSAPMPIRFGPFPTGHIVYVRARAWLFGGAASDWSNWWSIAGEVTGPQTELSDLVISNITDDGADLDWSYDESPQVGTVRVQIRDVTTLIGPWTDVTGSPFTAGTETTTLTGYTADHQYEVRVVLLDGALAEYGDVLLGSFHTAAGTISSLTLGTPSTDGVALSWTNTNTTNEVRIEVKLDTASVYSVVIDLPAGSTNYTLTGLSPETDYDVRVVLVSSGSEIGTALTDSFTTDLAANQTTLSTPTNAQVFEGWNASTGNTSPGTYGLEVTAVFGPTGMEIEFQEAVETAVGSGTPGSYAEVLRTPAVVGDVTRYQASAPNDGLLRYLKAKAVASGYTDSAYTTALEADPWPTTPTVPTPPSLTIGGMMPTYIGPTESFTIPANRQGLFAIPIVIDGILNNDGVLAAVD